MTNQFFTVGPHYKSLERFLTRFLKKPVGMVFSVPRYNIQGMKDINGCSPTGKNSRFLFTESSLYFCILILDCNTTIEAKRKD